MHMASRRQAGSPVAGCGTVPRPRPHVQLSSQRLIL